MNKSKINNKYNKKYTKITKKNTKKKFRKNKIKNNNKKNNFTNKKNKPTNLRQISLKKYNSGGSKLKAKVRDSIATGEITKEQALKNKKTKKKIRITDPNVPVGKLTEQQQIARAQDLSRKDEEERKKREAAIKLQNLARRKKAKNTLEAKKEEKKIQQAKEIIGKALLKNKQKKEQKLLLDKQVKEEKAKETISDAVSKLKYKKKSIEEQPSRPQPPPPPQQEQPPDSPKQLPPDPPPQQQLPQPPSPPPSPQQQPPPDPPQQQQPITPNPDIPDDMSESFEEYQQFIDENKELEKKILDLTKKMGYYDSIINKLGKTKKENLSVEELAKLKHAQKEKSKLEKQITSLNNRQKEIKNKILNSKLGNSEIPKDDKSQEIPKTNVTDMLSKKQEIQAIISQIQILQKEILSEQEKIESNIKNVNQDLRGDLKQLLNKLKGEYQNLEKLASPTQGLVRDAQYYMTFGKGNNGSTRLLDVQGPIGINANELLSLLNSSSSS